jgi:exopolysaccharide biosynthesis protein
MRKILLVVMLTILMLVFLGCVSSAAGILLTPGRLAVQEAPQAALSGDTRVINLDRYGITVLKTRKPLDFLYNPRGYASFRKTAASGPYRFLVNGAYFDKSGGNYTHAGWLSSGSQVYAPVKADAQLSCVVSYDLLTDSLAVVPLEFFSTEGCEHCLQFQTGPQLIDGGQITAAAIRTSINGKSAHLRTLLGFDTAGWKYLLITREPVALEELAGYLQEQELFQGRNISFVNLDGGSSTALFAADNHELNFSQRTGLPFLIGVR